MEMISDKQYIKVDKEFLYKTFGIKCHDKSITIHSLALQLRKYLEEKILKEKQRLNKISEENTDVTDSVIKLLSSKGWYIESFRPLVLINRIDDSRANGLTAEYILKHIREIK